MPALPCAACSGYTSRGPAAQNPLHDGERMDVEAFDTPAPMRDRMSVLVEACLRRCGVVEDEERRATEGRLREALEGKARVGSIVIQTQPHRLPLDSWLADLFESITLCSRKAAVAGSTLTGTGPLGTTRSGGGSPFQR